MNIIEALKLAKSGEKVRIKEWWATHYIYKKAGSDLLFKYVNEEKDEIATFYAYQILSDNWEILEDR